MHPTHSLITTAIITATKSATTTVTSTIVLPLLITAVTIKHEALLSYLIRASKGSGGVQLL